MSTIDRRSLFELLSSRFSTDELQQLVDAYHGLGIVYGSKGDYAQAYLNRGLAYKQQQQRDKAIADFEKVVALDSPEFRKTAEDQLRALATPSTK